MATKMKMVNKGGKMVPAFAADGKGKMKMGGSKKPLKKAQDGFSMGPTKGTDVGPSIQKAGVKVYSGPLTERDTKTLDDAYPSTTGKNPKMKGEGSYSPKAVESTKRSLDENYLRSGDSTVQKWNANQNYPGENYPQSNSTNYKKGGSIKKKMKTGGMVKPLKKAQKGSEVTGPSTSKKNILGRTVVSTPKTGNYADQTSKSITKKVYDKSGDFIKSKSKTTVTPKNPSEKSFTYKVTNKKDSSPKLKNAVIPVRKKGGIVKSKKK
jgi:hypothetical protein